MKIRVPIFCIALMFAIVLRWSLFNAATAQGQASAASTELTALLKERTDTLEQALNLVKTQYRSGQTSYDRVAQTEKQLTIAELDAAHTHQERLVLLKKNAANAAEVENLVKRRFQVGEVTAVDSLQARADALEARIALLREEQKPAASK